MDEKEKWNDKDYVLNKIRENGLNLMYVSDKLKDDEEVVLAAIKNNADALKYASDRLRNNKEVVLAAIKNSADALKYASDRLKNDEEVVKVAIKSKPYVLEYASDKLKDNEEVVLVAVENSPSALKYASDRLRNNKEVILLAIQNNADALVYTSDRLKDDKEVVLAAVENDGDILEFASNRLKNDEEVVLAAVKNDGHSLKYASDRLKNNKEIQQIIEKNNHKDVRLQDLEKDSIFDIKYGKAILLEGNNKVALIKQLGEKENPYIVATGLTVSKYKTYFEWKEEESYQSIAEANERFGELGGYEKIQNDLIYSEIGEWTLGSYNITRFNNVNEMFNFLIDEDINKEELIEMLSEKAKREVIFRYADVVIEEDGKFYYGQDLYFFEEEINEKAKKIDKILAKLNIKDVKPYDVIELLEQNEVESIDKNLENNIASSIKAAGYEKSTEDFINYINEELYKGENEEEEDSL